MNRNNNNCFGFKNKYFVFLVWHREFKNWYGNGPGWVVPYMECRIWLPMNPYFRVGAMDVEMGENATCTGKLYLIYVDTCLLTVKTDWWMIICMYTVQYVQ